LVSVDDSLETGLLAVHVGNVPVGGLQRSLSKILAADNDEVNHVAQIAGVVMDSAWEFVNVTTQIGIEQDCRKLETTRAVRASCRCGSAVAGNCRALRVFRGFSAKLAFQPDLGG